MRFDFVITNGIIFFFFKFVRKGLFDDSGNCKTDMSKSIRYCKKCKNRSTSIDQYFLVPRVAEN